jgi:thiol-disulfide isomerase/thioredoxin
VPAPNRIFRRALSCTLLLAAVCAFAGDNDPEPAPHFRAKTLTGESFNNDSVKGKVVLFEFWTTWCPYCRQEEALVDEVNQQFAGQGLIVLAVDVGEGKKKVMKDLAENRRSCRIVLTEDTNLAAMYAATSYPIYVVVDRDGNIVGEQRGAAGSRGLHNLLRRAGIEEK